MNSFIKLAINRGDILLSFLIFKKSAALLDINLFAGARSLETLFATSAIDLKLLISTKACLVLNILDNC